MECGVGHAAHPGSRAHLEYINNAFPASFLILRPHRSRIPNAFPVRRNLERVDIHHQPIVVSDKAEHNPLFRHEKLLDPAPSGIEPFN